MVRGFDSLSFSTQSMVLVPALAYGFVFAALSVVAHPLVRSGVDIPFVSLRLQLQLLSTLAAIVRRQGKPLYPNWSLTFEVSTRFMRFVLGEYGDAIVWQNAAMMREPFGRRGKMILESNCRLHGTRPEPFDFNGLDHMWLRDGYTGLTSRRIIIVHFHGGGFVLSHPLQDVELGNQMHSLLRQELEDQFALGSVAVDILLVNYRKAPEHPYPTPLHDCLAIYEHVLATENVVSDQVIVSGDSAGGWLAMAICKQLRDTARSSSLPLTCLLYSPVVDFDDKGDDEKTPHCVLPARFIETVFNAFLARVDSETRRRLSPVNWTLTGLPPMFVQFGAIERLYDQGMRFMAAANDQGMAESWEFDVLANMPHDIAIIPTNVLPFAKQSIHHACVFAAKQVALALQ
jgi:acetyl esterase/lipase